MTAFLLLILLFQFIEVYWLKP